MFRGSKSRNKVSVGEPAEGSLSVSLASPLDEIDNFSGQLGDPTQVGPSVLGGATCVLLQSHGSGPADCVSAGVCPWPDLVISPLKGCQPSIC